MARRAKKLEELGKVIEGQIIDEFEQINVSILKELVNEAEEITDPRDSSYVRHKLSDILMIVLFAVMANANEWLEIETFGKKKEKWLRRFLTLEHGVPTDDTYRIVLSRLDVKHAYQTLLGFLIRKVTEVLDIHQTKQESPEREIISLDGKAGNGSKRQETDREGRKALNTLNAYSSDWGMCIEQEFIDEKSNEIPAMPILISRLRIKGSILTWDALNTQKETVKAVVEGKGDYVGALKRNHENLYEDVRDYFEEDVLSAMREGSKKKEQSGTYIKTVEAEHSAIVTREYFLERNIGWLYGREEWAGLNAIGIEVKKIEKLQKNAEPLYERRYFIASVTDIKEFAHAVRGHWGIENGLHWHLDTTFKDDKNTTTKDNGAEGLQLFKKLALALLKVAQVLYPVRTSIKMIRYRLSLDYEREIERIFSALSADSIREVLSK